MLNGDKGCDIEIGEEEEEEKAPIILTREDKRKAKGLSPLLTDEEKTRTRRGFKRSIGTANIEKVYTDTSELVGPKSNSTTGHSTSLSPDKKTSSKHLNLLSLG